MPPADFLFVECFFDPLVLVDGRVLADARFAEADLGMCFLGCITAGVFVVAGALLVPEPVTCVCLFIAAAAGFAVRETVFFTVLSTLPLGRVVVMVVVVSICPLSRTFCIVFVFVLRGCFLPFPVVCTDLRSRNSSFGVGAPFFLLAVVEAVLFDFEGATEADDGGILGGVL